MKKNISYKSLSSIQDKCQIEPIDEYWGKTEGNIIKSLTPWNWVKILKFGVS